MKRILTIEKSRYTEIIAKHGSCTFDDIANLPEGSAIWIERDKAEQDPHFLQLIPYTVIRDYETDKVFLYERLKKGNEARLHSNLSIGVGGHIDYHDNIGDIASEIMQSAYVEIKEELDIEDFENCQLESTDITIFDPSNDVGKVHLGIVFTLDIGHRKVQVRETDKLSGEMVPLNTLLISARANRLETWSSYVRDMILNPESII